MKTLPVSANTARDLDLTIVATFTQEAQALETLTGNGIPRGKLATLSGK